MAKKTTPVKYTNRDFESIKADLINYAKVYYPDTYQDFSEASFGSLMMDMVAYVGDVLSFYLDYQANETYLDTAIEKKNLFSLAKQLGYKRPQAFTATGKCAFYVQVPSNSTGDPDSDLVPILKAGTTLASSAGNSFILSSDVDFTRSDVQKVVAEMNSDGSAKTYAYKAYGDVISGITETEILTVGSYKKFLKLDLGGENISEIISVVDAEGNEYSEVPYLSQNTVYQALRNPSTDTEDAPYILREKLVPRRFIVEVDDEGVTSLRFGYGSESTLTDNEFPDPTDVALNRYARNYYSDDSFDPSILLKTDKFGIVPPQGQLIVTYRRNDSDSVNTAAGAINTVVTPELSFTTDDLPSSDNYQTIVASLDVENEEPLVGDIKDLTAEEIRTRAIDAYASQNRAVTRQDYLSIIYRMPPKLGAVKRANIVQDKDSFKRNLNLYVVSEDVNGRLAQSSSTIKENLKIWLSQYKMINDTIDILDGQIVNIGIEFTVLGKLDANQTEILEKCNSALKQKFAEQLLFGAPFYISDIYRVLNDIPDVVDAQTVKIVQKTGTNYSTYDFDIDNATTADGRFIIVPENVVMEIKYPDIDIVGAVK
tara:strand:- start:10303 stop:12093 length:1791 start_codon:yes stop_codon:yes gene_type:complete